MGDSQNNNNGLSTENYNEDGSLQTQYQNYISPVVYFPPTTKNPEDLEILKNIEETVNSNTNATNGGTGESGKNNSQNNNEENLQNNNGNGNIGNNTQGQQEERSPVSSSSSGF